MFARAQALAANTPGFRRGQLATQLLNKNAAQTRPASPFLSAAMGLGLTKSMKTL
jgi:hypothetical protein